MTIDSLLHGGINQNGSCIPKCVWASPKKPNKMLTISSKSNQNKTPCQTRTHTFLFATTKWGLNNSRRKKKKVRVFDTQNPNCNDNRCSFAKYERNKHFLYLFFLPLTS